MEWFNFLSTVVKPKPNRIYLDNHNTEKHDEPCGCLGGENSQPVLSAGKLSSELNLILLLIGGKKERFLIGSSPF